MASAKYRSSIKVNSLLKGAAVGFVGTAAWYYYAHQARLRRNAAIPAELVNATGRKELAAAVEAAGNDLSKLPFNLYSYLTCPFCGKVKAFLDYHRIPHTVVEVEPMFKPQIAFSAYQKVPQLSFGSASKLLADSEGIVSSLMAHTLAGHNPGRPNVPAPTPDVTAWRAFASDRLSRYIVVAINNSIRDSWQAFDYAYDVPTIKRWEATFLHVAGAPVMRMVSALKTKPTLEKLDGPGVCANPAEAVVTRMEDFVDTFPPAVGGGQFAWPKASVVGYGNGAKAAAVGGSGKGGWLSWVGLGGKKGGQEAVAATAVSEANGAGPPRETVKGEGGAVVDTTTFSPVPTPVGAPTFESQGIDEKVGVRGAPPGWNPATGDIDPSFVAIQRSTRKAPAGETSGDGTLVVADVSTTRAPFHGGAQPDLADLEMYGVLNSARTTRVWKSIVANPRVREWIQRMDGVCSDVSTATLKAVPAQPAAPGQMISFTSPKSAVY